MACICKEIMCLVVLFQDDIEKGMNWFQQIGIWTQHCAAHRGCLCLFILRLVILTHR